MNPIRTLALCTAALLAAVLGAAPAFGQAGFPSKVVKIIVPFPAGGSADVLARIVGEKLSAKWGQPVVVENRVGAGGNIGAEAVCFPSVQKCRFHHFFKYREAKIFFLMGECNS